MYASGLTEWRKFTIVLWLKIVPMTRPVAGCRKGCDENGFIASAIGLIYNF